MHHYMDGQFSTKVSLLYTNDNNNKKFSHIISDTHDSCHPYYNVPLNLPNTIKCMGIHFFNEKNERTKNVHRMPNKKKLFHLFITQ